MSKDYQLTHYSVTQNDVNKELCCSICLNNYQIKETNVVKLNCGHVFHEDCIIPWFEKNPDSLTCPICRNNIYDPVVDSSEPIMPCRRVLITDGLTSTNSSKDTHSNESRCCILI